MSTFRTSGKLVTADGTSKIDSASRVNMDALAAPIPDGISDEHRKAVIIANLADAMAKKTYAECVAIAEDLGIKQLPTYDSAELEAEHQMLERYKAMNKGGR